MSKFPVEVSDQEGIVDAVNYLLSGPQGIGQNFGGFSAYNPVQVRPTLTAPYVLPIDTTLNASWTLNIPLASIGALTNPSTTVLANFVTPFSNPPFQFGDVLTVTGVTPSFYNKTYTVYSSSNSSVLLIADQSYTWPASGTGGNLIRDFNNLPIKTDCNATITVTGPTDRVFVTAQAEILYFLYNNNLGSKYDIVAQINRYKGSPNTLTPNNANDFTFVWDGTVTQQLFARDTAPDPILGDRLNVYFTTSIDGPNLAPGYYYYSLDIVFVNRPDTDINIGAYQNYDNTGYYTQSGQLVDNGFVSSGTSSLVPAPGTVYNNVPITTVTGPGVGAVAKITVYPDSLTPTYAVPVDSDSQRTITLEFSGAGNSPGSGYSVTQKLRVLGTAIGGTTPADDLNLTISAIDYSLIPPATVVSQCGKLGVGLRSLTAQVIKQ